MEISQVNKIQIFVFKQRDLLIEIGVFLVVLIVYSLDWSYSLMDNEYNFWGGVSTVGSIRVLRGEIPYRDFWTMYAPGHFYFLALIFYLFGQKLIVEVIAASIICSGAALILYKLVIKLSGKHLLAVASAAVYVAATYNTGYFKRVGTYPLASFLIFLILLTITYYLRKKSLRYLISAGLEIGALIVIKHDVGIYTAISVLIGLAFYHILYKRNIQENQEPLYLKFGVIVLSSAVIVLPVLIYFSAVAGGEMYSDLVVFPLTDFPLARPENYRSLFPVGIFDVSLIITLKNLADYFIFLIPSTLFLFGLAAIVLSTIKKRYDYSALGAILVTGFLLHYRAAHIQINTHIITMSVYAALLGVILLDLGIGDLSIRKRKYLYVITTMIAFGWLLVLSVKPVYLEIKNRVSETVELSMDPVYGFRVSPNEARVLDELSRIVKSNLTPEQRLYVGLHRHDVLVVGDVLIYFVLGQPIATKYHELHPAISDTIPVQLEIIEELKQNREKLIVLRHIFPDELLNPIKADFVKNLPKVGATDLDRFIQANYQKDRSIGPYDLWILRESSGE